MGMSEFYGTRRRSRGDRDDPPRPRPRRHAAGHRRHLRPAHQRAARRRGDRRPPRRGRAGDQVRDRPRPREPARARRQRPPRLRDAVAATPRCAGSGRPHRPLLPAPGRPRRPDRGDGRGDGRARRRRQGPLPRSVGGRRPRRSAAPTPCTRSARCRASTRCGAATPRTRSCRRCASWGSAWSPTARSAAASSPARSPAPADLARRRLPPPQPRAFRARTSSATSSSSTASRRSPREKDCTPGQLALAWVLAQGEDVVPIPGTKRRSYLEENVEATELELDAEDLARLDEAAPGRRGRRRPLRRHVLGRALSPRRAARPRSMACPRPPLRVYKLHMPRAIWTGAISFGLVNVPVKLYSATSPKTVRFHQLSRKTGARIRQKRVDPVDRRRGRLRGHRQGL